ncbi:uncharacterized protein LOC144658280 isoform X2 [Oculina patagonica]
MNFSFLVVFASWISMITYPTHVEGLNRELYFPSYYFFADKRLKNHKIKTEHVMDLDFCELLCYQHDDCVSFNIKKVPDSATGQQDCELNNSTHMEHDGDLTEDNAYLYRGAKNTCGKNPPCYKNAKCQSGFTEKGYRCLCTPGFAGEHCKQENWKKINNAPVCFGARDDTYGTFNIKESGLVYTFKLVHRSGYLKCIQNVPASYWGCDGSSYGDERLLTVITYPNKTALLLADYLKDVSGCGKNYYLYQIAGIGVNSPELVFNKLPTPLSVSVGQEFHIWYGQDLKDCSEDNNDGQTCADVYAWYA